MSDPFLEKLLLGIFIYFFLNGSISILITVVSLQKDKEKKTELYSE
jgi:hypothetical protein